MMLSHHVFGDSGGGGICLGVHTVLPLSWIIIGRGLDGWMKGWAFQAIQDPIYPFSDASGWESACDKSGLFYCRRSCPRVE